jgi:hypothetical protein
MLSGNKFKRPMGMAVVNAKRITKGLLPMLSETTPAIGNKNNAVKALLASKKDALRDANESLPKKVFSTCTRVVPDIPKDAALQKLLTQVAIIKGNLYLR